MAEVVESKHEDNTVKEHENSIVQESCIIKTDFNDLKMFKTIDEAKAYLEGARDYLCFISDKVPSEVKFNYSLYKGTDIQKIDTKLI